MLKNKRKALNAVLGAVAGLTLIGAVFGFVRVKSIEKQYNQSNEVKNELIAAYVKEPEKPVEPQPAGDTEQKPAEEQGSEPAAEEKAPLMIDFDGLSMVCKFGSVAGWLYCEDTQINYPVAQCDDNFYYLHRLIDGTDNFCGTLYTDFRAERDFQGLNTIIYGHNMINGSMFGDLKQYITNGSYYEEHPTMYLFTPTVDYRVDIASAFVTVSTNEWLWQQSFEDDMAYQEYLNHVLESNKIPNVANVPVTTEDNIITMVTCSYETDNARTVVVGKLVEIS